MTTSEVFSSIISYLFSSELQQTLYPIRAVFSIFSAFFFVMTVWFFLNTSWFKEIFLQDFVEILTYKGYWNIGAKTKWRKITNRIKKHKEEDCKLALIEADNMLDETLGQIGYIGSLEEKLGQIKEDTISNIIEVRKVHTVINSIKHDPNYNLSVGQTDRFLDIYRKIFKDLEIF
ncbi:MAG: hypothetical protein ABH876_00775 [Patescibacteria group bacterium]|nr:hypothetical protein [Patescibacteria group bacterium]MBU1876868.1 hypothetical protein [Patescibacteria group bacterium]